MLTVDQVLSLVGDDQRFFSVRFVKRTTGEVRDMTCRRKVVKHLAGGTLNYDAKKKGLITVWDPNAVGKNGPSDRGYRSIPVESIQQIRANGRTFVFEDGMAQEVAA